MDGNGDMIRAKLLTLHSVFGNDPAFRDFVLQTILYELAEHLKIDDREWQIIIKEPLDLY